MSDREHWLARLRILAEQGVGSFSLARFDEVSEHVEMLAWIESGYEAHSEQLGSPPAIQFRVGGVARE